ncbi:unnamed protein product, partial [marine sediment metagenome]
NLFDGKVKEGGKFIISKAELDVIPAFIKEDSVIPFNLSSDFKLFSHIGNEVEIQNLCLIINLTELAKFTFNEGSGFKGSIRAVKKGKITRIDIKDIAYDYSLRVYSNGIPVKVFADNVVMQNKKGFKKGSWSICENVILIIPDEITKNIKIEYK